MHKHFIRNLASIWRPFIFIFLPKINRSTKVSFFISSSRSSVISIVTQKTRYLLVMYTRYNCSNHFALIPLFLAQTPYEYNLSIRSFRIKVSQTRLASHRVLFPLAKNRSPLEIYLVQPSKQEDIATRGSLSIKPFVSSLRKALSPCLRTTASDLLTEHTKTRVVIAEKQIHVRHAPGESALSGQLTLIRL